MKILFIYSLDDIQSTSKPLRSWTSIQFGISYISSLLKTHGHETTLLVLGRSKWKVIEQQVKSKIGNLTQPLSAIQLHSPNIPSLKK